MRRSATGVALTLELAGCASTSAGSSLGRAAANPSAPLPATRAATLPAALTGSVETLHPGSLTAKAISDAQTAFGLDLMAKVCGKDGPNTLISCSGLGASIVSRAVQKDVMTVDQLGTVAAAATGVMVEAAAAPTPKHAITLDRPFLLLLEDTATHTPLFLASIGDPSTT